MIFGGFVFVSFNMLAFIFWLLVANLLPGAILSFSIFKKDEKLIFIEKLFIGFALGIILLPLIPFLLYLVLGIKFGYSITLLSVGLLYAMAVAAFFLNKAYEGIKLPALNTEKMAIPKTALLSLAIIAIILAAYVVRVVTYSPIFQELDPYYYTDTAQQLLTMGENPFDDQTSWYPEVSVNHRIIPILSYLEAGWYSLYTAGGEYNNMLLALIASMYPPVAAALFVFFVYLLVSASGKREWGAIAAGIAAFAPVLVYKLAAGEQEVQPYAFFSLFFFFSMYALSIKRKDLRFSALAGLGFAAVALGSSSQLLAVAAAMLFITGQSLLFFLRDEGGEELKQLILSNSVVFVIGPLLGSALLKDIFSQGQPSMMIILPFLAALCFSALLYVMKLKIPNRDSALMALAAVFIVGIIAYAATPLGAYIGNIGRAGFEITQYNSPLDRTIAEQGGVNTITVNDRQFTVFDAQMGFVAVLPSELASTILWPVSALLSNSPALAKDMVEGLAAVLSVMLVPVSWLVGLSLTLFVGFVNIALGTDVSFGEPASSLLLLWIFLLWVALVYSTFSFFKKEDNLFLLFAAIIMPPLVVGMIKAKYTIYATAMIAVAIGFSLGPIEQLIPKLSAWLGIKSDDETRKTTYLALLALGTVLVLLQFSYHGFSPSLLWGSTKTLFQNDPAAVQPMLQSVCAQTSDSSICAAAADPVGYASQGTNYQYSETLCALSLYSNYSYLSNPGAAPSWEAQVAYFRCQRLSSYWIDSMEWIKNNTEPGARIISWWDYGHWINFFGQRNAVIRNEHVSHQMIGAVAHAFLDGTPEDLKNYMQAHDTRYALFDMELVSSGSELGGKYGALNYLSCAWDNQTTVEQGTGASDCEAEHLWETAVITTQPCTISSISNKTGLTAYRMYIGTQALPRYPDFCVNPADPNVQAYCGSYIRAVPAYCIGQATMADGNAAYAPFYLDQTYPNGDLKLNKAFLQLPRGIPGSYHFGDATEVTLFYTDDAVWLENGEIKSGYEDRKGKFYSSNLYKALFLNSLPGFRLVYTTPGGAVKIYEVED